MCIKTTFHDSSNYDHEILARLVVRGAGSAIRQSFRLSLMKVSRQTRRNLFTLNSLRDQSAVSHPPSLPFSCDSIDWIHPFFDLCLTLRYSPVLPRLHDSDSLVFHSALKPTCLQSEKLQFVRLSSFFPRNCFRCRAVECRPHAFRKSNKVNDMCEHQTLCIFRTPSMDVDMITRGKDNRDNTKGIVRNCRGEQGQLQEQARLSLRQGKEQAKHRLETRDFRRIVVLLQVGTREKTSLR